jgi:hypothetical protein
VAQKPRIYPEDRINTMSITDQRNAPETAPSRMRAITRNLALGAVVGPAIFTLGWITLGFFNNGYTLFGTRIPNYSPLTQPISGLGLGRTAPIMNTLFVLTGVLLALGILAALKTTDGAGPRWQRRLSTGFLLLIPVGSIIDGLFTLQSMAIHDLGFFLATGSPIIGFLVLGTYFRRIPGWQRFGTGLLIASPITLALFVLFFLTFTPTVAGLEHGIAGLVQRILVLEVFTWLAIMAIRANRRP